MLTVFRKSVIAAALVSIGSVASAAVLTFDDLPDTSDFFKSNMPYHGFTFGTDNGFTDGAMGPATRSTDWFWAFGDATFPAAAPNKNISTCPVGPNSVMSQPDPAVCALSAGTAPTASQAITSATDFVFHGADFSGFDQVYFKLFDGNGLEVHTSTPLGLEGNLLGLSFLASGYGGAIRSVVVYGNQNNFAMDNFSFTRIPEPGSMALAFAALGALGVASRRRKV